MTKIPRPHGLKTWECAFSKRHHAEIRAEVERLERETKWLRMNRRLMKQIAFVMADLKETSFETTCTWRQNMAKFGEWTKAADAPLPMYGQYLVKREDGETKIASRLGQDDSWWNDCREYDLADITHWMPLPPDPPSEREELAAWAQASACALPAWMAAAETQKLFRIAELLREGGK